MARSYSERDGLRNQPSFSVTWRTVGPLHARAVGEDADRQPRIVDALQPNSLRACSSSLAQSTRRECHFAEGNRGWHRPRRFTLAVEPYNDILHHEALRLTPPASAFLSPWQSRLKTGARQARRCGQSGGRLWKSAEVDHRVPLFRVWSEHRETPWPDLLSLLGPAKPPGNQS